MRSFDVLERMYRESPAPPRVRGRIVLLVARLVDAKRQELGSAELSAELGLHGDRWADGPRPDPDRQLTLMNARVAELVAAGQPLSLPGDNVLVDLDLSSSNLPVGTRLRLGTALVEVTAKPHTGCKKFAQRFGPEAMKWVNHKPFASRRLRGINCRILEPGTAALDDLVDPL